MVNPVHETQRSDDREQMNPIGIHPVLSAFLQQHDCPRTEADLAFRVYLNLAEVRGWRDVSLHFCENLQRPFVTGRATLSAPLEVAFPVAMEESLSHQQIQTLFSVLHVDHEQFDRVLLAICASDTSIVYYKVSSEIIKPEPPEVSDARKQEWQLKAAKRKRHVAECIDSYSQQLSPDPP